MQKKGYFIFLMFIAVVVTAIACEPERQPGVQFIPPLCEGKFMDPQAISSDGLTVAGFGLTCDDIVEAFRWSEKEGTVRMGFLPGYEDNSFALSVSGDGAVIVGTADNMALERRAVWFWTKEKGMRQIPMPEETHWSEVTQVTENGEYVLGGYFNKNGIYWGYIWSEAEGPHQINVFAGVEDTLVFQIAGITYDGLTVFTNEQYNLPDMISGAQFIEFGKPFGKGNWAGKSLTPSYVDYTFFLSERGGISKNGNAAAGYIVRADEDMKGVITPAVWLAEGQVIETSPQVTGEYKAISPDGSVAGGGNGDAGTASIWNRDIGDRNLIIYLQGIDSTFNTGFEAAFSAKDYPSYVTGIAGSNKRLIGTAGATILGADNYSAFVLDLP